MTDTLFDSEHYNCWNFNYISCQLYMVLTIYSAIKLKFTLLLVLNFKGLMPTLVGENCGCGRANFYILFIHTF